VEAHHIRHWADGGETTLRNLVEAWGFHHGRLHEGGFGLARGADATRVFRRPDGARIPSAPLADAILAGPGTLEAPNEAAGLEIDERTAACRWLGERMGSSPAVEGGMPREGLRRGGRWSERLAPHPVSLPGGRGDPSVGDAPLLARAREALAKLRAGGGPARGADASGRRGRPDKKPDKTKDD